MLNTESELCGNYFCIVDKEKMEIQVHDIMLENMELNKLILSKSKWRIIDLSGQIQTDEDKDNIVLRAL